MKDIASGPLTAEIRSKEQCHGLDRTITCEQVENGIFTIYMVRNIASGPLHDQLLAKPDKNLQIEYFHGLDREITCLHVENGISTINNLRDITSGPLQDQLLSKPDSNL